MYYLIENDENRRFESDELEELLERCIPDDYYEDATDDFNSYLDDEYGSITVYGNTYWASELLYDRDEDEYYDAFSDWQRDEVAACRENAEGDLLSTPSGSYRYIGHYSVYAYEDEPDTDEDQASEACRTVAEAAKAVVDAEKLAENTLKSENARREESFESLFQMISK